MESAHRSYTRLPKGDRSYGFSYKNMLANFCGFINKRLFFAVMVMILGFSLDVYMNNLGNSHFLKLANGLSESAYWLDWGELWTTPKPMNSK